MNAQECMDRLDELARFFEQAAPIENLEDLEHGLYAIAGRVPLPCFPAGRFGINSSQEGTPILDIPIMLDGEEVGLLCLTSKLRNAGIPLEAATDAQKLSIVKLRRSPTR